MSVTRIASRYAKSLLDLAVEQKKLDRILKDVESLKEATDNQDFHLLLKSPIISKGKKADVFKALFAERFDEMSMRFIHLILNKGRESYIPDIAKEFIEQYRTMNSISIVKVTTATPLSETALEQIKTKLLASSETGKNVEIVTKVNPDILGGFVIEINDKLYDDSVAHKLEKLRKELIS